MIVTQHSGSGKANQYFLHGFNLDHGINLATDFEGIGLRNTLLPGLQSSLTLWILDLDSEPVFAGDTASNEPSRPSRRWGVEFANFYRPTSWLTLDLDFAYSNARFTDRDPAGPCVPEAIESTLDAGVAFHDLGAGWQKGFYGSLRLRF